jgi:hypothetical protein
LESFWRLDAKCLAGTATSQSGNSGGVCRGDRKTRALQLQVRFYKLGGGYVDSDEVEFQAQRGSKKCSLPSFVDRNVQLESAVGVLADVTKRVWIERATYETKLDILDEILGVIVAGRPTKAAIEKFTVIVKEAFFLMPTARDAIERHIGLWHKCQMDRAAYSSCSFP